MELNEKWTIWSHGLSDNNWNNDSYKKIVDINNLLDLKLVSDTLNNDILLDSMIFLMKDTIFPTWEDPLNQNGCTASYRIADSNLLNILMIELITLNLFKNTNDCDKINGLSISSKKKFYILKIWFKYDNKDCSNIIKTIHPLLSSKNCRLKRNINQY